MYKVITTIKSTETAIYDDDGIVYDEERSELTPREIEDYL